MKVVYLFILLVFGAAIMSAGCTTDRTIIVPEDSGLTDEERYGIYDMESGEGTNETGPVEVTVAEEEVEYYDSGYVVGYNPDELPEEEEEPDYSIDESERGSGSPLDAIKDVENYSVQDSGTVTLNTDTGEVQG